MVACWYMDCFAALAMTRGYAMTSRARNDEGARNDERYSYHSKTK